MLGHNVLFLYHPVTKLASPIPTNRTRELAKVYKVEHLKFSLYTLRVFEARFFETVGHIVPLPRLSPHAIFPYRRRRGELKDGLFPGFWSVSRMIAGTRGGRRAGYGREKEKRSLTSPFSLPDPCSSPAHRPYRAGAWNRPAQRASKRKWVGGHVSRSVSLKREA